MAKFEILNFFKNNSKPGNGSYYQCSEEELLARLEEGFERRWPGMGRPDCSEVCVVPISPLDIYARHVSIKVGMKLEAQVKTRDRSDDPDIEEEPFIEVSAPDVPPQMAKQAAVVLYHRDELAKGSNPIAIEGEWGLVALLTSVDEAVPLKDEPMDPETMARNQLEKPGGTYVKYSSEEWARAVWFKSQRVVRG